MEVITITRTVQVRAFIVNASYDVFVKNESRQFLAEDDPIRLYARLLIKRALEDYQKGLLKASDQSNTVKV